VNFGEGKKPFINLTPKWKRHQVLSYGYEQNLKNKRFTVFLTVNNNHYLLNALSRVPGDLDILYLGPYNNYAR
jgi:hypothetical protein